MIEKTPQSSPTPHAEESIQLREETQNQMLRGENLHDGAITLNFIGDIDSVPALLTVLKKYPPISSGAAACPNEHAVEALEKITGEKLGSRYEDWNKWWLKYQKKRKINKK